MKYVRTKDGIISSAVATHELTQDICDFGYLKTLGAGSLVSIGETWSNFYGRFTRLYDTDGCGYDIRPDKVAEVVKKLPCAETIEELCDRFVLAGTDIIFINKDHTKYRFEGEYDNESDYEWFDITETEIIKGIYGAIWTEWGLKYVAKMNEKGEFKLL